MILAALMILATGCTAKPTSTVELPQSFISDVEIAVGDTEYGAMMTRFADGIWQVEMTEPAAVKGLIFTVSGAETDIAFEGLRFTFDTERFPVGSVVQSTLSKLDRLFSSPVEVLSGEDQCLAAGNIAEESFTLTLSKTNVPEKAEFADSEMTVTFKTFDLIEKDEIPQNG